MVSHKLGVVEGFKTNWLWPTLQDTYDGGALAESKRKGMGGEGLAGAILLVGAHSSVDPAFRRDRDQRTLATSSGPSVSFIRHEQGHTINIRKHACHRSE